MTQPLNPRAAVKRFVRRGGEFYPIIIDDDGEEREVVWAPLPGSQCAFLECTDIEVLLEGNRGGGKTDTLIMDFVQDVGKGYGAEWRGVLFRQTHPMLRDVIEKSKKWIKRLCPDAFYNEIKYFWEWPTGERLYFSHFDKASDYDAYHGHNYPWIAWEELSTWSTPDFYKRMFTCLRTTVKGIPLRVRSTTNPYGPGHNWIQARFQLYGWPIKDVILGPLIETSAKDEITGLKEPPRRAIHSDLAENQILNYVDPDYRARVGGGAVNEAQRKAWVDGSWDITSGGMFDDIWGDHKGNIVVPEFQIPEHWPIFRALDYGSSKPWSCGYYAKSDGSDIALANGRYRSTIKGDLFRIGEVYGWTGQPNEGLRLSASAIAAKLIEYEIQRGWRPLDGSKRGRVKAGPADTGIFDDVNGACLADDFEKPVFVNGNRHRGIIWVKADKGPGSRKQGWEQIRKRLKATKPPPSGYREDPGLFVMQENNRINHWIRTVPILGRDEKDPDDVNDEEEDHVADECRYALRFEGVGGVSSGRVSGA